MEWREGTHHHRPSVLAGGGRVGVLLTLILTFPCPHFIGNRVSSTGDTPIHTLVSSFTWGLRPAVCWPQHGQTDHTSLTGVGACGQHGVRFQNVRALLQRWQTNVLWTSSQKKGVRLSWPWVVPNLRKPFFLFQTQHGGPLASLHFYSDVSTLKGLWYILSGLSFLLRPCQGSYHLVFLA